jgi:hypothetical protein
MTTESITLAILGGLAGLALAYVGTRSLLALMFPDSPTLSIQAAEAARRAGIRPYSSSCRAVRLLTEPMRALRSE